MNITANQVKELRERTGCGMMDCKNALVEANADMQIAIDILRKKGLDASAKKAGRVTAEGVALAVTNSDQSVGVLIEVNSETDFVAKNSKFLEFVEVCAKTVMENNVSTVDELLNTEASGSNLSISNLLKEKILVIGENIKIRRFVKKEGAVACYVHSGGRVSTLVEFETSDEIRKKEAFKEMSKDIAMHIAAASPLFLDSLDVPQSAKDHEKKILQEQLAGENKPPAILEKIIAGRMNKFYKESCLLHQEFVKNPDFSVSEYVQKFSKDLNGEIKIKSFARYEKGEDI